MGRTIHISIAGMALCGAIMLLGDAAEAAAPIDVPINQLVRVPFKATVANVVVGNSKIADVSVVNTHSVVIMGKGLGATGVMVFDNAGHVIFDGSVNITQAHGQVVTLHSGGQAQNLVCMPVCEAVDADGKVKAQTGEAPPQTVNSNFTTTIKFKQ